MRRKNVLVAWLLVILMVFLLAAPSAAGENHTMAIEYDEQEMFLEFSEDYENANDAYIELIEYDELLLEQPSGLEAMSLVHPGVVERHLVVPHGRQAVYHLSRMGPFQTIWDIPGIFLPGHREGLGATYTLLPRGGIRLDTGTTNYQGTWAGIDVVPAHFGGLRPGDVVEVLLTLDAILDSPPGVRAPVNNGFRIESSIGRNETAPRMWPSPNRFGWNSATGANDIPLGVTLTPRATAPQLLTVPVDDAFIMANSQVWDYVGSGRGVIDTIDPPRFRIAPHIVTAWENDDGLYGLGGAVFTIHDILIHRHMQDGQYNRNNTNEFLVMSCGNKTPHFQVWDIICLHGGRTCPQDFHEFFFDPRLVTILHHLAEDHHHYGRLQIRQDNIGSRGFRCRAWQPDGTVHVVGRAADVSIQSNNTRDTRNSLYDSARSFGAWMKFSSTRNTSPRRETYIDRDGKFVHISVHKSELFRVTTVNSSVNIHIYNSGGRLVGRIIDDIVDETIAYDGISLAVDYGIKYVYFFSDNYYTIRIAATDHGTMTYATTDFNTLTGRAESSRWFEDVDLYPGREFAAEVEDVPDVRLLVVENGGGVVDEILPTQTNFNFTVNFELNGGEFVRTTTSMLTIMSDTPVGILPRMPTAASPNGIEKPGYYRFTGWFTDVNDENTRWRSDTPVTGNITLYARWEEILNPGIFRVGSVTGNGRVTSADATMIARWLVTSEADRATIFPNFCRLAADIDGDGEVTIDDLTLLARWLVGHNVRHLIAL